MDDDDGNKHGSAMICLSLPISQNLEIIGTYHYLYSELIGYPPRSEWGEKYLTLRD